MATLSDVVRAVLVIAPLGFGALLMLVAAIGVLRMPDLLLRMQAATKAGALGAGLMFLAALAYFAQAEVALRVLAAIFFIFLTLPLAAHLMARASYLSGIAISSATQIVLPEPESGSDPAAPAADEEP